MKIINQKPKILLATPYFPPLTGGVQNYVSHIATGLHKNYGWEIVIVTSSKKIKSIKIENRDGLKIYYLPVKFNISNTPVNPEWYLNLKSIFNDEKPNLINAHAPVPFLADLAAIAAGKTPFILTYHTGSMKKGKA